MKNNMKELIPLVVDVIKRFNLPCDEETVVVDWLDETAITITAPANPLGDREVVATLKRRDEQLMVRDRNAETLYKMDYLNLAVTEFVAAYFKYICWGCVAKARKE
jgi:hypothetical protein